MKNNSTDKFNTPVKIPYTYTSAYKGLYPVVYCDDVWHIAKENTTSGEVLGTGQITQEELNNILVGGSVDFNEVKLSLKFTYFDTLDNRADAHFLPLDIQQNLTPDLIELGDALYNSSDIKQATYTRPAFDSEETPSSETWNYVGDDAIFTGNTGTKLTFAWREYMNGSLTRYEGFIWSPDAITVTIDGGSVTTDLDADVVCSTLKTTTKTEKLLKTILSKL